MIRRWLCSDAPRPPPLLTHPIAPQRERNPAQTFFKQLLNSLKATHAIEESQKALDKGWCVVIGLLSTQPYPNPNPTPT